MWIYVQNIVVFAVGILRMVVFAPVLLFGWLWRVQFLPFLTKALEWRDLQLVGISSA